MRSLRPPPRVTPPKPPAHLFEPREDIVPVRLDKQLEKSAHAYEDDVKFQMHQLEEEMRQLLAKESDPGMSMMPERNQPPARASIAPKRPGGDPFATAINPGDWKKNGFPSEFAYMKAMGQLEISNAPPPRVANVPPAAAVPPSQRPRMDEQLSVSSGPGRAQDRLQEREQEMISPARRKGGAIQNLYNDEENLRRKFVSQHEYSDQLQRQANEQRLARESEVLEHRGLQQQRQAAGRPEDTGGMRFPSEQGGAKPNRAPPQQWPPAVAPGEGRFASAPPQRPEATLPRGQIAPDYTEHRVDPRYAVAPDPYRRGDPSRGPGPAQQQQPWGPDGVRGAAPPRLMEQYPQAARQPVDSPPRKPKNEPANTSLALGMDKQAELALKRAKQEEYKRQLDSLGGRQQPQEASSAASLALGMDKQSEHALKRAKQEEYKRQLDALKPRQEVIPAARSAVVDSNSYLHTGVRPAQPRAPVPGADAYHASMPPQRSVAPPALPVGAMTSYPSEQYRGGAPVGGPYDPYDDPTGHYAQVNHMDRLRDPHNAPLQVRNQGDHTRYLDRPVPMDEASGHYASANHLDRFRDTHDAPVQVRDQGDHLRYLESLRQTEAMASNRRFEPAAPVRSLDPRLSMDPRLDPYFEESRYRGLEPSAPAAPVQNHAGRNAQQQPARAGARDEKEIKRLQQEEYRRELERQMQEKQAAKDKDKKLAEDEDERFLRSLAEADPDGNSTRRKKGQPGQAAPDRAPPGRAQPESSQPREVPPPQVSVPRRPEPLSDRYEDDVAAEYAYMKAKGLLPQSDYAGRDPGDRWESQSNDRYDDRGGADGPRRPPADYRPEAAPNRNDRALSLETDGRSEQPPLSPSKSPNVARARFMKDIYGGDLIAHGPERANEQGVVGGPGWRPSLGGVDDRKRQVIAEQKAALDLQKAANEERRKKEKDEEEAKDRKKEERERAEQERIEEGKRLEKKKKDDFNAESARDLAQLQEKRAEEAMARKGRGRKPAAEPEEPQQAAPPPKVNPRGGQEPERRRAAEYDSPPREDYEHIKSPVRDAIRQHAMLQQEQQLQQQERQSQQYGARGVPPQLSMYQVAPVDTVDSFVRNYRPDPYQSQSDGMPPQGYGARPPYGAPAPYGSYDRDAPQYQQQYANPHPPPHQYQQQRYPQPQYPPLQLQRGNFYPDQNPDVSLVSESRLIPNNPWSSSDILSSLVPVGARAAQAANAAAEAQARQYEGRNGGDLERSMASESAFIYLGRRTPAANENPRAKASAALSASVQSAAELPRSSRPIASPANAQLADLIAETNRVIERETAQAAQASSYQTKEVPGASGKRASPQLNSDGSPKNRLGVQRNGSGYGDFQLGDNDGISTVARQETQSSRYNNEVLDDIPAAKNRIFLGQKQDYDVGSESHARDSTDSGSIPLRAMVRGSHMSTQTSTPNLLQLPAQPSPDTKLKLPSQSSAESSPRADETPRSKGRRHSSFVTTGKSSRSPRSHHRHHRHRSPGGADGDALSTPLEPMRAEAAISPMKPARASSAGSERILPGAGGEFADLHRRDALGLPPSASKGVGKKSPRQRTLENKAIREATGGAPRTKFPEPEPEPEEVELPEYSRPRRNVLNANESVVAAPAPGTYKSPRQRALERQLQKNAAVDAEAPAQEIAEDEPISDEPLYEAEEGAGGADAEVADAGEGGGYEYEGGGEAVAEEESPASYEIPSAGDLYSGGYEEYTQEAEDPGEGPYVARSAEELYGDEYAEETAPPQYYDDSEGYVVPSAEDMYGEEEYQPEIAGDPEPEPYVVPSAEETYGDGYAEGSLPPRDYSDAEPYVVPSAEDMYGDEYSYEQQTAPEYAEEPGSYEVGSAEDLYGGGEYEVEQVPLEDDDGAGGYVVSSAEETYGAGKGETDDAAGGDNYLGQDYALSHTSADASPRGEENSGRSPRKNVLDAAGALLKPSADHRSPRQRALDNKAIREGAGGVAVSPRSNIAPYEAAEEEDVEPEHVRQRKNVLNANEAIIRPAVNQQWSPRGRVAAHNAAIDGDSHAPSQLEEQLPSRSRPSTGKASARGEHTFSRDILPDQSLDAFLGEIDRVVARAQSISSSRPASGRPRTGVTADATDAAVYGDYLDSLAPRIPSRPASGRPRTGRSRVASAGEDSLAASAGAYGSHSGASRPASGRPLTGVRAGQPEEPASRSRTGVRGTEYESIGGDALDAAVAFSAPSSRPASGRPLTSRQVVQPADGDVLDQAIAVADRISSRPASGRPRTSQAAVPQGGHTDILDREMSLGGLALGSRPTSSGPTTARGGRGEVVGDALDHAVSAPSNSRPSTGRRPTEE